MSDEQLDDELRDVLGDPGAHALRDVLRDVGDTWEAPMAKTRSLADGMGTRGTRWRSGFAMAATVLLLLGGALWLLPLGPASPESLAAEYAQPYPMAFATRGTSAPDAVLAARDAYTAGDYAAAGTAFQVLANALASRSKAPTDDAPLYRLYAGVAELLDERPAEATATLAPLLRDDGTHLLTEQARWYSALAQLQLGEEASAKTLLVAINEADYMGTEAAELRAALE